ncbi:MAG: hypothetical protein ACK4N5_09530, partial [Myxococcales bacterium]
MLQMQTWYASVGVWRAQWRAEKCGLLQMQTWYALGGYASVGRSPSSVPHRDARRSAAMIPVELERVSVSLDVAGAGTRVLAWLVDFLVLFFSWTALFFLATLFGRVEVEHFADIAGVVQTML